MVHRRPRLLSIAAVATVVGLFVVGGCAAILGDFEVGPDLADGAPTEAGAKASGATCAAGTECATGFCTDGVCCESACDGTCETCGGAEPGRCLPVPDGTDPAQECAPVEEPPQAQPEAGSNDDDDGGDASAGEPDAGRLVNIPDGGVVGTGTTCAGTCNGARGCKYPGAETSCGTKFCNAPTEAAYLACDGKGHCDELAFQSCSAYQCLGEACGTACISHADCLDTHYCNTKSGAGVCTPKLGNGVAAGSAAECQSGFFVNDFCCATDCPADGRCNTAGGVCTCTIGATECTDCVLFYRDADGDGYGDPNGETRSGCGGAPPSGFAANGLDCADGDRDAHPGQDGFFERPIVGARTEGTDPYDFNCDGKVTKAISEFPRATCHTCAVDKRGCVEGVCVKGSTAPTFLECRYSTRGGLLGEPTCSSPNVSEAEGFTSAVACGGSGTVTTCKTCGTPIITTANVRQTCR